MRAVFPCTALVLLAMALVGLHAQTQGDMNKDAAASFRAADDAMNTTYRKVLQEYAGDEAFIARAKEAQRCWLAFRDAQLKMKYPEREPRHEGSIQPMCEANYLAELTRERNTALQAWVGGTQEGDLCAGSVRIKP